VQLTLLYVGDRHEGRKESAVPRVEPVHNGVIAIKTYTRERFNIGRAGVMGGVSAEADSRFVSEDRTTYPEVSARRRA
jgi:hypothetical protein